jgi:hypothetical protein
MQGHNRSKRGGGYGLEKLEHTLANVRVLGFEFLRPL